MKITFVIPDWAIPLVKERHLRLFAGLDPIARKMVGKQPESKMSPCALCGKCCVGCEDLKERQGYKQPTGEWAIMCERNEDRPQSCANSDGFPEDCQIVWEKSGTINTS